MRVLLIEAAAKTGQEIKLIISPQDFNLSHTGLGEEGLDLARLYDYHIIVIDLDLPDMCGHEVLRTLRTSKIKTPVVIVSQPCDVTKKVRSLNLGADDHIIKPIHKDELTARLGAIIRRSSRGHAENTIDAGILSVNIETRSVQVNGKNIDLSKTEYRLLEILVLHIGKPLSRKKLHNSLYPEGKAAHHRPIDVWICKLRKKLGDELIQTVRGYGFGVMLPEEVN